VTKPILAPEAQKAKPQNAQKKKRFHYTYRLIAINPIDERVEYIGVRSSDAPPEDDTQYWSSSLYVAEAANESH